MISYHNYLPYGEMADGCWSRRGTKCQRCHQDRLASGVGMTQRALPRATSHQTQFEQGSRVG